jgi:ABC-type Mn2+/Zn2+ transport system permease subunit
MAIVSGVVLVGSRAIVLTSFDRGWARTIGIRVGLIDAALLLATALALGVALRGLGGLLALAMLIGPAAIARPWVRRVGTLLLLTIPLGLLAGCLGLLVSFHFGWAAGPAIATIIAGLFLASRGAALAVDARSRSANAARHA